MATRNVTNTTKKRVAAQHWWKCAKCNSLVDELYEIDHRVPLWAGGSNEAQNLQLLCYTCHGAKTGDERDMMTCYNAARRQICRDSEEACWKCATVYSKHFADQHVCAPSALRARQYSYYGAGITSNSL